MTKKALYIQDAIRIILDKRPHALEVWELSTGNLLYYPSATLIGENFRKGVMRVRLAPSFEIRAFRQICLLSVDGLEVFI